MISNNNTLQNLTSERALYRVWIRAHEGPNAPLVSVWIDSQMRAFEADADRMKHEPACTETVGFGTDACAREEDECHLRAEIGR